MSSLCVCREKIMKILYCATTVTRIRFSTYSYVLRYVCLKVGCFNPTTGLQLHPIYAPETMREMRNWFWLGFGKKNTNVIMRIGSWSSYDLQAAIMLEHDVFSRISSRCSYDLQAAIKMCCVACRIDWRLIDSNEETNRQQTETFEWV